MNLNTARHKHYQRVQCLPDRDKPSFCCFCNLFRAVWQAGSLFSFHSTPRSLLGKTLREFLKVSDEILVNWFLHRNPNR